jgi:WS/DGAT/MGAT family acyltransferase
MVDTRADIPATAAPPRAERTLRFERRMTDTEALMWLAERDPILRSSFQTVTLLDGPPDHDRFVARMRDALQRIPRLRQRVVEPVASIGPPTWADDPDFDLKFHIRRVALPSPGTDRQLFDMAAFHLEDPFDPARPLWQFTIVEGLEGGRAALITKMHHTISDGVGAVRLSAEFVDLERSPAPTQDRSPSRIEAEPEPEPEPAVSLPGAAAALLGTVGDTAFRLPLDLGRRAIAGVRESVTHPLTVPRDAVDAVGATRATLRQLFVTDGARSTLWSGHRSLRRKLEVLSADLDRALAAARKLGGTLNDLYVAGVLGGVGDYHRAYGVEPDEFRVGMPVSTRADRSAGGNAFLPARMLLPAGIEDPRARMLAVHERLTAVKGQRVLGLTESLAGVVAALPAALVLRMTRQQADTVDFAVSNVRGAPVPLYIGGARILANYPFGPTGGTACNVTLLSYASSMDIGINCDASAVEDPGRLGRLIGASLESVIEAGSR